MVFSRVKYIYIFLKRNYNPYITKPYSIWLYSNLNAEEIISADAKAAIFDAILLHNKLLS